jgi:hypothetical protein
MTIRPEELEGMRAAQEATTFADECRIERRTRGAYDEEAFTHPETVEMTPYEGPCDVYLANDMRSPEFGEAMRVERVWHVAIPTAEVDVREGDVAVIVAARDPWAPRELNVSFVAGGGFASRRRLVCKELG